MIVLKKTLKGMVFVWFAWIKSLVVHFTPRSFRTKKDVSKETVLITGAGSGLGRVLSLKFAALGSRLVLWDLNLEFVEETARMVQEISDVKVHTYQCDVADRSAVNRVADKVKEEVGSVTILINNAGILVGKSFIDVTPTEIERTFYVNVLSIFWTLKAFLPDMMAKNHGHLVTIASAAGLMGSEKLVEYCSSKYAVVGLEEALRVELSSCGHDNIHSTVVCPFFIRTGLYRGLGKTAFIPQLTPEFVAQEIVDGVLLNEQTIFIPHGALRMFMLFKACVPTSVYMKGLELMENKRSMQHFRGGRNIELNGVVKKMH